MLLLLFQAGNQTYALDARHVIEVAPFPVCTKAPHAPPYVEGLATCRGRTVPVIDLVALIAGIASKPLLSTRLILVEYKLPNGHSHPLGLVAEKVVETVAFEQPRHEPQKIKIPDAPYLNGTVINDGRLVQQLALDELLPRSVCNLLFPGSEAL
jgi:chemotaxis-related protein WspB